MGRKLETTQEFTKRFAQELANDAGETYVSYMHNQMVHTQPVRLKAVPADAIDVQKYEPISA